MNQTDPRPNYSAFRIPHSSFRLRGQAVIFVGLLIGCGLLIGLVALQPTEVAPCCKGATCKTGPMPLRWVPPRPWPYP